MYHYPYDLSYRHFPNHLMNNYPTHYVPMNPMIPFSAPMANQEPLPIVNTGYQGNLSRPPNELFSIQNILDHPIYPVYEHSNMNTFQFPNHLTQFQGVEQQNKESNPFIKYFKNKDGSVDLNKMVTTAGQLMGTLNQFQAFLKGFSHFFKTN